MVSLLFVMPGVFGLFLPSAAPLAVLPALPGLYDALLVAHPVPTRMATAGALALVGDAAAQQRSSKAYNRRRGASLAAVEVTYRGLLQQPIFDWIIHNIHGEHLRALTAGKLNAKLSTAIERVTFNQFVVSPFVFYPMYFTVTGMVQGLSLDQTLARARSCFTTLFGFNLCFWLPVQLTQFGLVPARYKVPFICVAGLIWNVILSALSGSVSKYRGSCSDRAAAAQLSAKAHTLGKGVVVPTTPTSSKYAQLSAKAHTLGKGVVVPTTMPTSVGVEMASIVAEHAHAESLRRPEDERERTHQLV